MAIVCSSQTPYRLHMHRRFVREIPEVRFYSLFAHERDIGGWRFEIHPDLGTVCFGMGEEGSTRLMPRYFLREWSKGGRMIRWMEKRQIRAVILIGYDVANLRVLRWCRHKKIPCFLWGDNNVRLDRTQLPRSLVKRAVLPRIISQFTAILVCGRLGEELYLKYGADPKAIFFSPCEPDYALIEQVADEDRREARVLFNLAPARRRIVFSGRLAPEKRVDLLIDAYAKVAAFRPNWDLLVIGDGPLREALETRVPSDIRHRVTWTGFIDRQMTISALYSLCDVLVLPSDRDSWGLVMNEAAAAGLAMAASDVVGAAKELIRSNINGFVFPSGSAEGLADCLMKITDPNCIDAFCFASKEVLREWRRDADPVDGLRKAMVYAGVLRNRKAEDSHPFDENEVF